MPLLLPQLHLAAPARTEKLLCCRTWTALDAPNSCESRLYAEGGRAQTCWRTGGTVRRCARTAGALRGHCGKRCGCAALAASCGVWWRFGAHVAALRGHCGGTAGVLRGHCGKHCTCATLTTSYGVLWRFWQRPNDALVSQYFLPCACSDTLVFCFSILAFYFSISVFYRMRSVLSQHFIATTK